MDLKVRIESIIRSLQPLRAIGAAMLLIGCYSAAAENAAENAAPSPQSTLAPVSVKLVSKIAGLKDPVGLTFSPTQPDRLLISERRGRVRIFKDGKLSRGSYVDVSEYVEAEGKNGLYGIVFPKDYASSKRIFIAYTDVQGDMVIASLSVENEDKEVDPESIKVRLKIVDPNNSARDGNLAFGPDGLLYLTVADGANDNDEANGAQNLRSLFGKILRINVSSSEGYSVPDTNPFNGKKEGIAEILALGFRRPGTPAFGPAGEVIVSDGGSGKAQEINLVKPGGNYGWNAADGETCVKPKECQEGKFAPPIASYAPNEGSAVISGVFYHGESISELRGRYIFGDRDQGTIWTLTKTLDGTWAREVLLKTNVKIAAFGEDAQGEVYVLSQGGEALRIER